MDTKKKSTRTAKGAGKTEILSAYRNTLLREGKQPSSVFTFCESIGLSESEFYLLFGSFDAIEKEIWGNFVELVVKRLKADSSYSSFSMREKMLAFYYTLLEELRGDRSFVLFSLKRWKNPAITPVFLNDFKASFNAWLNIVLNEGKQNGEIAARPFLDKQYDTLFWLHLLFILQFWSHDDSKSFEKTDAAIEKSVNLAVDLIGKGVLDNALDFGKFLYQNSKN